MKKFGNITIGGIQQKIFNLVLITIILIIAAFSSVIFYQTNRLTNIVKDSSDEQRESITSISEQTMKAILDSNLTQSTLMEAYIAGDVFKDTERVVKIIADYTVKLFASPDNYPDAEYALPDKNKNGEISVQVLTEEGIDINDATISDKLSLIGNLSDLMIAVYADSNVDSCYCALPDGVMLLVDNHSGTKFNDDGDIINIPIRDRLWYKGAKESKKLHYTDVTTDLFTGEISIMCSLPVYNGEELVAIIGADLFLNAVSDAVNGTMNNGSFVCIINNNGHVLFSPETNGIFSVTKGTDPIDLRNTNNEELNAFVNEALASNTEVKIVKVDDKDYYLVGAPIQGVGWAVLSVVPKSLADQPGNMMIDKMNSIQGSATESFNEGMSKAKLTIYVLIGAIIILTFATTIILTKRIVKPLEAITRRILALGGDDLQFKMEDEYRTKDEIEALAQSFADLSAKTVEYISQIEKVTAEKERIGTELALATRIQADMLPNIYPAFPERAEFDIFASMNPAKEVGGDFYDFFLIDDDHLCVFIADVSGKGVPAALFMMASMIILANNAQMGKTPAQILQDTNAAICSNNREEMFVTVWLGILEISTGKLRAANAGHEYPVIKYPNGKYELFKDKHGFVIGGFNGAKYQEYEIDLEPGSVLFLYTDGIPEATNKNQELFGENRMLDALNNIDSSSPKDILDGVRKAVDDFVQDAEQFDDLTMVSVEYKKKG